MSVVIPDEIIQAAKITEAELKLEIAIMLYQQGKISGGKARHFALCECHRVSACPR